MNLEDRVRLLEEKIKAVEEFMVSLRHEKEFKAVFELHDAIIKGLKR